MSVVEEWFWRATEDFCPFEFPFSLLYPSKLE
jgi:hypothetical protein